MATVPASIDKVPTVRRRLLALLLPPLIVVLAIGVLLDYGNGIAPLRQAQDQALANAALALASRLHDGADGRPRLEDPQQVLAPLAQGIAGYRCDYRIRRADGRHLFGDAGLPEIPADGSGPVHGQVHYDGHSLRLLSYRMDSAIGPVVVSLAESDHKYRAAGRRIIGSLVLTDVLQLAATVLLVWFGVRHGLRPLQRIREELAARSPSALEPLHSGLVPGEVRPLINELNRLLATVRSASAAQQRFLADAAHQIRTPLAGLQTRIELMLRRPEPPHLQQDLLALQHSVARLTHTTHQLLALARAEPAARTALSFEPVDLAQLTAELVEREFDHALDAQLDLGLEAAPASTDGVPWLLRELLANLIANAIQYTPAGGCITVRCGQAGGRVFLEVEDDGPGIPESERDQVCRRFYRLPDAGGEGCGLGLAIVEEVARLHGARLRIHEGARRRGTRMRIDFPPAAGT